MKRSIIAVSALLWAASAGAAAQRTFVSAANGDDTNPCLRLTPCRNFAAAIAQTNPGGEVVVLDSGGYGPVSINQAVSIEAPDGIIAGITTFSGTALEIAAGQTDTVIVRGLTINGLGTGAAIDVLQAASFVLLNTHILSGNPVGLYSNGNTVIKDSTFLHSSDYGLEFQGGGGPPLSVVIENCRIQGDSQTALGYSIYALNHVHMAIRNSVITNRHTGLFLSSDASTTTDVAIENTLISGNFVGIVYSTGAVVRVSNSTITQNQFAFVAAGGSLLTRQNNTVIANVTTGSFTGTFAAK
jgi:hypothetical protein